MALRVLLIGAGGVFGSRIAAALAHDPRFALTLAGRHPGSLQQLREHLGDSSIGVATLDVASHALPAAMALAQPQLVIHAAGPFQRQDYRVAEACLARGSDYVDLADGRRMIVPLAWYPRLMYARPDERQNWQLLGGGYAIEFPALDEHIGMEGLLAGRHSGESRESFEKWLNARKNK